MDNEKSNQNIINFAFVVAGFLVYLVVNVLFETLAATWAPVARIRNIDAVRHGVPVVLGLITFLMLVFNAKVQVWADESVSEVRKVVWPSRKDTVAMTIVCCVMVVVAGIGLGAFDFFASQLIKVFVR